MEYKNPTPVVVGLVFVEREEIVVIRRSIEPHKGGLALPGGYVELGEDWRTALQREIREEAQIRVSTDPEHMSVHDVHSTPDGSKILIFAKISTYGVKKVLKFRRNKEVSERLFSRVDFYSSPNLCFPCIMPRLKNFEKQSLSNNNTQEGGDPSPNMSIHVRAFLLP